MKFPGLKSTTEGHTVPGLHQWPTKDGALPGTPEVLPYASPSSPSTWQGICQVTALLPIITSIFSHFKKMQLM